MTNFGWKKMLLVNYMFLRDECSIYTPGRMSTFPQKPTVTYHLTQLVTHCHCNFCASAAVSITTNPASETCGQCYKHWRKWSCVIACVSRACRFDVCRIRTSITFVITFVFITLTTEFVDRYLVHGARPDEDLGEGRSDHREDVIDLEFQGQNITLLFCLNGFQAEHYITYHS